MTEGGTTTTYTYDDWGRTISKSDGTHSTTYGWRFRDKLNSAPARCQVALGNALAREVELRASMARMLSKAREEGSATAKTTAFPSTTWERASRCDGLGKRRLKLLNPGASTDADYTWYRWDAGWNMIGEYAAGTDTGTTWDVGALTRWYQGKAAYADGDPDSTAYNYYAHDRLGSPRTTYSQGQAVLARIEFTPYGSPLTTAEQDMDLGYTGHKWDEETGSFYAPYRYYSPESARWWSHDLMPTTWNYYSYVENSPMRLVDSLGLAPHLPTPFMPDTGGSGDCTNAPPQGSSDCGACDYDKSESYI